jgi:uncharacterized protein (DUF1330 family)
MNTYRARFLAALIGFGLGVVAVKGLQAQSKPPVYLVSEIELLIDPDAYMNDYASKSQPIIKAAGGRFLAGGQQVTAIEGTPPKTRVAITMWDSMEQMQAWWNSPNRKELLPVRAKVGNFRSFAVEGLLQ